jgi:5-dehydro-2-deoxygluconokinase
MSDENVDVITVGRISLDFYANESNVGFEKVKTFTMSIGGSPTNVAIAAARLGNKSAIVTNIGKDSFNEYIISKLKDFNVNTDFVGVDETEFTPAVFAAMNDPFDPTEPEPVNDPDEKSDVLMPVPVSE